MGRYCTGSVVKVNCPRAPSFAPVWGEGRAVKTLRLGLAQINTTVGAFRENVEKIAHYLDEARERQVDLVAFPELAVPGYPPEDLLLRPAFIDENLRALESLVPRTRNLSAVIGFVDRDTDLYNAAAFLHDGRWIGTYHKRYLPTYGVFDEDRYFRRGGRLSLFRLPGVTIGVSICEDLWYHEGPALAQALAGADVVININASPYHAGKGSFRERLVGIRAADDRVILAYVNAVGGQDELVFDGQSLVCDERGELLARAAQFEEELLIVDVHPEAVFRARLKDPRARKEVSALPDRTPATVYDLSPLSRGKRDKPAPPRIARVMEPEEERYRALCLGLSDYVRKNNFSRVVVGLSGGVDSSLTVAIAADALGSEAVSGLFMPYKYTSAASQEDARALADNLGIRLITVPIHSILEAYLATLSEPFRGRSPDVTEENLQARVRGALLMAFSNKFGWLVLTTGNKSELSVGYATLYGDMAGGFAVVKDLFKTEVYRLARYRNRVAGRDLIPQRVLERPPTAELKENQLDQDTLPPYDALDPILHAYIEEDRSLEEITAMGHASEVVRDVIRRVESSEYKRRQSPVGIKITPRAFGRDRRMPITHRYRGD